MKIPIPSIYLPLEDKEIRLTGGMLSVYSNWVSNAINYPRRSFQGKLQEWEETIKSPEVKWFAAPETVITINRAEYDCVSIAAKLSPCMKLVESINVSARKVGSVNTTITKGARDKLEKVWKDPIEVWWILNMREMVAATRQKMLTADIEAIKAHFQHLERVIDDYCLFVKANEPRAGEFIKPVYDTVNGLSNKIFFTHMLNKRNKK